MANLGEGHNLSQNTGGESGMRCGTIPFLPIIVVKSIDINSIGLIATAQQNPF